MPRSIQEILDHGDDLVQRFVDFEPVSEDQRPVAEYLLQRAVLGRARSERQLVEAVQAGRSAGMPWSRIGQLLGTSAQAVRQRYGTSPG